jgi:hypothetical protein
VADPSSDVPGAGSAKAISATVVPRATS